MTFSDGPGRSPGPLRWQTSPRLAPGALTENQLVHFAGLSDRDRKAVTPLPKLAVGDRLELHVHHEQGEGQRLLIPPAAAAAVEALLAHMLRGDRVAVLAEDQELSPTEASAVLGISRPLVVLRMDRGDLPFRYVGKHRRALLKDVLSLKTELDTRQAAIDLLESRTAGSGRGSLPDVGG